LIALYSSKNEASLKYSYGYLRAEIIGAMGSIFIIWALLAWLISEAIHRIKTIDEVEINGGIMLITSILGLGCNILNLMTLKYCSNEETEDASPADANMSISSAYTKFRFSRGSFGSGLRNSGSSAKKSQ
jgi:zinc transporter 2